jgi:hypothetical protein
MFPKWWYARVSVRSRDDDSFVWFKKKYARNWQDAQAHINEDVVSELGYGWSCNIVSITEDRFLEGCRENAILLDELIRMCHEEVIAELSYFTEVQSED